MKNVRAISTLLFYLTRILAALYLITTFYSAISLLTEWSYIIKDEGRNFSILYPFSESAFLNGENTWSYKFFNFLMPLGFYGLFFLLVSNVFKVFMRTKLFTANGVKQLKWFYLANIILPPFTLLLASVFDGNVEEGLTMVAMIHFILGIFSYFMAAIFRQGLQLQNEQDLYI